MTDPDDVRRDALLARAESLEQTMDNLRDEFRVVQQRLRQTRTVLWILSVSLVLSVAAVVAVGLVANQASNAARTAKAASSQANVNRQSQIVTCLSTNEARKTSKMIWLWLIDTSLKQPQTPESRALIQHFRTLVVKAYQPRDCSPSGLAHSKPPSTKGSH